jgi:hypothetical protein
MHPGPPGNLLSFIATEHENEMVSIHKHGRDLDVLAKIDCLYQAPVRFFDIPSGERPLAQLYLFIHYHLYSTVSNLLRMHVAEALGCERKAIDAALSAYEMLADPTSIPAYQAREWKFLNIKRHIEKARKKDASRFPLAEELLSTWDMCSEFGAHADDSAFALRLEQVPIPTNADQQKLYFLYFQLPSTTDEAHFYYVDAFANFLTITRIFEPFVQAHAKGLSFDGWREQRDTLDAVIRTELARLHQALDGRAAEAPQPAPESESVEGSR